MSERLAEEVISLPMHAYLEEPVQDRIVAAVRRALAGYRVIPASFPQARSEVLALSAAIRH